LIGGSGEGGEQFPEFRFTGRKTQAAFLVFIRGHPDGKVCQLNLVIKSGLVVVCPLFDGKHLPKPMGAMHNPIADLKAHEYSLIKMKKTPAPQKGWRHMCHVVL
jgi:hypothetical protein